MFIRINLISIIMISLLSALPAQSQWTNRGEYSELKAGESAIVYLKATADGKAFFTQSADTLRKWDIESGELLDEKYLEGIQYGACAVSDDEKYYAYSTSFRPWYLSYVKICSYENDKLIDSLLPFKNMIYYSHGSESEFANEKVMVTFLNNDKELLLAANFNWYYAQDGGFGGILKKYLSFDNDSCIDYSINRGIWDYKLSYDENLLVYSFKYTASNTHFNTSSYNAGLVLYDSNKDTSYSLSTFKSNYYTNIFDTRVFDLTNDDKIITAFVDYSNLISWNTEDRQIINNYPFDGFNIKSLKYEKNKNFLLLGVDFTEEKPVFLTVDCLNHTITDTMYFDGSFSISDILQTNDSTIILSCSDGYVRKISPEVLSVKFKAIFATPANYYQTGDSVKFNNYSTGNIKSCHWQFGDGYESYETDAYHHYKTAGEFVASLVVSDGKLYDTMSKVITVKEKLFADFSSNYNSGYLPLEVRFYDKSEGDIEEWLWNFGDGTSFNGTESHSYFREVRQIHCYLNSIQFIFLPDTLIREKYMDIHRIDIPVIDFEREIPRTEEYFGYIRKWLEGRSGYEISRNNFILLLNSGTTRIEDEEFKTNYYMQDIIKLTSNDSIINLFFQERDHSEVISRSIHLTQQKNIINYGRINFFNLIDTTGIQLANNDGCGNSGDIINLSDSSIIAVNAYGGVTYYHDYSLAPAWNYNFNSSSGPTGSFSC